MAKLKFTVDDVVEVIGPLREFYVKGEDNKYHLDLDGDSPRLKEFRENNRALNTQKTELETQLAALKVTHETELKALKEKAPDPAQATRVTELESQLAAAKAAHSTSELNQKITYEFLRKGGRESAVDFTIGNASKVFSMKDGKITTELFSTKTPGTPLTLDEWIEQQQPIHHYCFLPSRGGGAGSRRSGGEPAKPTVSRHDPLAVGQNLENIASGKVTVE